jgi:hypothetical protein
MPSRRPLPTRPSSAWRRPVRSRPSLLSRSAAATEALTLRARPAWPSTGRPRWSRALPGLNAPVGATHARCSPGVGGQGQSALANRPGIRGRTRWSRDECRAALPANRCSRWPSRHLVVTGGTGDGARVTARQGGRSASLAGAAPHAAAPGRPHQEVRTEARGQSRDVRGGDRSRPDRDQHGVRNVPTTRSRVKSRHSTSG